ncbi:MAG: hypothetical protein EON47_10910, partial [Acetobacteraceae bacterium]
MPRQSRSFRVLAPYLSLTVLVIGALVASFAVISQRAARQAEAEAVRMTQAVATGLSDQLTRALQGVDLLMLDIASRRRAGMDRPLTPELLALAADMPQLRALMLVDPAGKVVAASVTELVGRQVERQLDLAALLGRPSLPWLGRPVAGRWLDQGDVPFAEAGIWSIPLARAIRGGGGQPMGAVVALLNPDYLANIGQRPAAAFGVEVRFHTFDGTLVARSDNGAGGGLGGIGVRREAS